MLYVIENGYCGVEKFTSSELVIFITSLHRLVEQNVPFAFTNGHAYPTETEFYQDLTYLDKIDWELLKAGDFRPDAEDPSKKTRYQAEALVHRHLPITALLGVACHSVNVESHLRKCATKRG